MNTKCYIANYAYRNKADDYKYDLFIFGSVTELCFFLNEHWNLEKKKTRNLVCTALQAGTKFDIKLLVSISLLCLAVKRCRLKSPFLLQL